MAMDKYTVRYQAATYTGTMTVTAENSEHAIAIVRSRVRKQMSLPMYYEHYEIAE